MAQSVVEAAMPTVLDREDMQGLIARGYKEHCFSCFAVLRFSPKADETAAAKTWLSRLHLTDATHARADAYINIAFTYSGLERLGLPEAILSGFSDEFCGGITAVHRRRILGDEGVNAPQEWKWGNETNPVDAVLLVYARSLADLDRHYDSLRTTFAEYGIQEVAKIDTCRFAHGREHFGFHDDIANPVIEGLSGRNVATSTQPVKAGEFILGYENEYQRFTARPVVDRVYDPRHLLKDDVMALLIVMLGTASGFAGRPGNMTAALPLCSAERQHTGGTCIHLGLLGDPGILLPFSSVGLLRPRRSRRSSKGYLAGSQLR